MLPIHIFSAFTSFFFIAALGAFAFSNNIPKGKKLYPMFTVSSISTIVTGSLLAISFGQHISAYCTNMGSYLAVLIAAQALFHLKFYEKGMPLLPFAAQLSTFGVTALFLLGI